MGWIEDRRAGSSPAEDRRLQRVGEEVVVENLLDAHRTVRGELGGCQSRLRGGTLHRPGVVVGQLGQQPLAQARAVAQQRIDLEPLGNDSGAPRA